MEKRLIFESDNGYMFELNQDVRNPRNILELLDGNTLSGRANTIQIPGMDGTVTYGLTRSAREIRVRASVRVRGSADYPVKRAVAEMKNSICCAFDPRYFGTMYYYAYHGDGGKKIRCRPTGLPAFEPEFANIVKFSVGFISDGSEWTTVKPMYTTLGISENLWTFDYELPSDFAFIYGSASLYNPTNYEICPVIHVYESIVAVEVTNASTGSTLTFNRSVGKDERLVVDVRQISATLETETDGKWIYSSDVMNYLDISSSISDFKLIPGENNFKVKAFGGVKPVLEVIADIPIMGV